MIRNEQNFIRTKTNFCFNMDLIQKIIKESKIRFTNLSNTKNISKLFVTKLKLFFQNDKNSSIRYCAYQ